MDIQQKWYDRPWAAFIFFTRLPFWRLHEPPRECYQSVVEYWPLTGWLTGAVMGCVLYFASGNLLAGYSVDYMQEGFRGLRDFQKLVEISLMNRQK